MIHQSKIAILAVLAAIMALTMVGTTQVNAQWTAVGDVWNAVGMPTTGVSHAYQITLSSVHCLYVVDMECAGEQYQVSVNGISKGTFPLAMGDASIVITRITGSETMLAFKPKSGACPEPPAPFKVVTSAGKVSTRAAAVAACQAAGRVLVDVTPTNKEELLKVVRASPDIKMNPFDGVMIASWSGNSFAGVGMQMLFTNQFSMVALVLTPVYPLCALPSVS
ncbi:hypothetical protein GGF31_005176 [Allomyces arbusculus]|nr:hypothetical protein GGF31_005176 [Allomyces arbusculus]